MGRIHSGAVRVGLGTCMLAAVIALCCATPAWSYLYWANGSTIGRAAPDGSGANASFASTAANSRVAVDGQYMYWINGSAIGRASLDGSSINPSFISGVGPSGLAVTGQYVYWTHAVSSGTGSIGRANLDGSGINTGFITGLGINPTDLAVNRSYIYWTDFWASAIGRANLDGTGVNQTFIAATHTPLTIAVDAQHIYWYITYDNTIGRANLDGSGKNLTFIAGISAAQNVSVGLAVDNEHIYWTNPGNGTIGRANIDGSSVNQSFLSGMSLADGLAIDLPPTDVALPSISGSPAQGSTLTAVHGMWTMYPSSYADQWYRCDASGNNCTAAGSASPTYGLSHGDVGSTIRVTEAAGNAYGGSGQPAMSAPTSVVTGTTPSPGPTRPTGPMSLAHASVTITSTGSHAMLAFACRGAAGATCAGAFHAVAHVRRCTSHNSCRQISARLGRGRYGVRTGRTEKRPFALDVAGRRALSRTYALPSTFTFTTKSGSAIPAQKVRFAYGRISAPIEFEWLFRTSFTTVPQLNVRGAPRRGTIFVACHGGGCPFHRRTIRHRTTASLSIFFSHARLRPGATVQIAITAPADVGKVATFTIQSDAPPTQLTQCLLPGTSRPTKCA